MSTPSLRACVLWSGGLDSTALITGLLEIKAQWGKHVDVSVRALSFNHDGVAGSERHRAARDDLADVFAGYDLGFKRAEILVDGGAHPELGDDPGLIQPIMWVGWALPFVRCDEMLLLGYTKGDEALAEWAYIHAAARNLLHVCGKRKVDVLAPLRSTARWQIVQALRDTRLLSYARWCESPKKRKAQCSRTRRNVSQWCESCLKHHLALVEERARPRVSLSMFSARLYETLFGPLPVDADK